MSEIKLYYHETDGGAQYLCSSNVPNTNEGSLINSSFIVRIDGNIAEDATLSMKEERSYGKSKNY